ncbi:MAG: ABC transporter permease subunit/CPBP intramembrane protease, partial [Myxococcota bacterium]
MRWSMVRILWFKELMEMLRDRRTLAVMILLPIVLYPALGLFTSQARVQHRAALKRRKISLGWVKHPRCTTWLRKHLLSKHRVHFYASLSEAERALHEKQIDAFLSCADPISKPQTSPVLRSLRDVPNPYILKLHYQSTRDVSKMAQRRLVKVLRTQHRLAVEQRLRDVRVPGHIHRIFELKAVDRANAQQRGQDLLGRILPLLIVLMTVMGAFYPAIDLTAGEKERGTLETLLTAPISSLEIVAGKYLTVLCIALLTGLLNLLSIGFTFRQSIQLSGARGALSMDVHVGQIALLVLWIFLTAALAAALMLTIASLARSFKEGQNYVTPAYMASFFPAFLTTLPASEATTLSALVPFMNVSFAMKHTLKNNLSWSFSGLTLLSMVLMIAVCVRLAARFFQHEELLFRSHPISWKRLFLDASESSSESVSKPSVRDVLVLCAVLFVLLFYVGMEAQKASLLVGLLITLWVLFLGVTAIWSRVRGFNFQETFSLRTFSPRLIPPTITLVLSLFPFVIVFSAIISSWFSPAQQQQFEQLNHHLLRFFEQQPLWLLWFVIAFSAGFCEEFVFRGFVFSGLRQRLHPGWAMVWSGLLFGLFHLQLVRLFPTTVLGILLGWLCWRSGSIFLAMFAHTLHNTLVLWISWHSESVLAVFQSHAILIFSGGALGLGLSLWMIWQLTDVQEHSSVSKEENVHLPASKP